MEEIVTKSISNLHLQSTLFVHEWTITNFKCIFNTLGDIIYSDKFLIGNQKCCLALKHDGDENISVSIINHSNNVEPQQFFEIDIFVIGDSGEEVAKLSCSSEIFTNLKYESLNCEGSLSECTNITVISEVKIYKLHQDKNQNCQILKSSPITNTRLLQYFKEDTLTDVRLIVCGNIIKAHKVILSIHSSKFHSMFSNLKFNESKRHEIYIDNFSYDVMKALITYMYSEKIVNIKKIAMELVLAVDFYGVPSLEQMCFDAINDLLNVELFCEIFMLGRKINSKSILDAAIQFFQSSWKDIVKTSNWEKLTKSDSELCLDLFKKNFN